MSSREVTLGEVCEIKQGKYLSPGQMEAQPTEEAFVPVVGGNGILGYTTKSTFTFPLPLVTCRGSKCGLMQWAVPPTWVSNNAMAVYFKDGFGDNFFLYQYLLQSDFDDVTTGSAQPQITVSSLALKKISLPALNAQRAIAQITGAIEEKIQVNREISETLEATAQAIFKSWFIDFDPVKAKMAGEKPVGMDDATAALFPDSMEDSELGQIPTGWSKSSMGNFVQARRGKVITKSKTSEGSIPVIAGGLEPAYFHNVANVLWPAVTVSASGANAGFVRLNLEDIWASDCSYISKSETESVYTCYLFLKVQQDVIFSMQQGGAQPHIYPSDLSRLNFPVPGDLRIFERFEELIAVMFEKVRSLNNQTALFIAIRDSLLPRLISGELQIPEEMLVS